MTRRALGRLLLALALVAGLLPLAAASAPAVLAAAPDLTLTADTRYDVDPPAGLVHVTVALTATNHLKDTKTRQYYFDRAYLAVQPGTANFAIGARTGSPTVKVTARKADHTLLQIDFGRRLPAGSSRTFTLTFDITDPGGAPTRDVRIGPSLVSFGAWAFASPETPGGSVTVAFPEGYSVEVQSDQLGEPTTEAGRIVYASGRLANPLTFFAFFIADKPSAYTETRLPVEVDGRTVSVAIRAWPDDPAWAERVGALVGRGLPILAKEIGLPWRAENPLAIAESISRSAAGYSGRYDPAEGRIEIAYYASSFVVLHEVAHAWFDGSLLAERWATEGFASWYALRTAAAIDEPVTGPTLSPEILANRTPLNAWTISDGGDTAADAYGYAASTELARLIAERAGPTGLASVWQAARQRIAAYQPAGLDPVAGESPSTRNTATAAGTDVAPVERTTEPPDWRGFLDLLEDRTGRSYDDLWRAWVVRPEEAGLLTLRATTRRQYDEVVARAGEWRIPAIIRQAMRAWQFDDAKELLTAADAALDDRDAVTAAAKAAGLEVPRSLQAAFESDAGFAAAATEADAQLATIEAYESARDARPDAPSVVEQVGLWWATPELDIERAATAFGSGDLRASVEASSAAFQAWTGADEKGRSRIATIIGAIVAATIALWLVISTIRSLWRSGSARAARARESRRRRVLQAHPAVAGDAFGGPGESIGGAGDAFGGPGESARGDDAEPSSSADDA